MWLDAGPDVAVRVLPVLVSTPTIRDASTRYLKFFTFLDEAAITALEAASAKEPEKRHAQRELSREVTRLVHGATAVQDAEGRQLPVGAIMALVGAPLFIALLRQRRKRAGRGGASGDDVGRDGDAIAAGALRAIERRVRLRDQPLGQHACSRARSCAGLRGRDADRQRDVLGVLLADRRSAWPRTALQHAPRHLLAVGDGPPAAARSRTRRRRSARRCR